MPKRKKTKKRKNVQKISLQKKLKKITFRFFLFLKNQILTLPGQLKRYILASLMFLLALVCFFSFFDLAGQGGQILNNFLTFWFGQTVYLFPLVFLLFGFIFLLVPRKLFFTSFVLIFLFLAGIAGSFSLLNSFLIDGGKIGDFLSLPLKDLFGELVTFFVFFAFLIVSVWGFWHLFSSLLFREKETAISTVIRRVAAFPKFKVLKIESEEKITKEKVKEPILEVSRPKPLKFTHPPLELLEKDREKARSGNIEQNALLIKRTLENFGIEVTMGEVNVGPTVTQYTLKPAEGIRLSKITTLANNLSLALAAHPIRIEAPIPGKSLVGIEVPNKVRSKVRLRDLVAELKKFPSNLTFVLGRDVAGAPVFGNLVRLPHLLVAGSTGTGKTMFLNCLILSLLYQNSPKTLRLVLIDPKRVEFSVYSGLPHLLCPIVLDAQRAVLALKWLVEEMERRFQILSDYKVKDIFSFNNLAQKQKIETFPFIVLIVDELADLMAARGKEIEAGIVRIAQMARAVGIHLIVATQRPSVEVLTGLIKANITSRIAFQVATQIDSRTILDMAGAERLLGLGDMLYISAETVKPKRIQGAFVSEEEIKKVVNWIKENVVSEVGEDELFRDFQEFTEEGLLKPSAIPTFQDPLYEEAKRIVIENQKASASFLQRRLQIGYARAARLLDMLEAEGIVGPPRGAKPREVYLKPEQEKFD